jgi:hypothetical protein
LLFAVHPFGSPLSVPPLPAIHMLVATKDRQTDRQTDTNTQEMMRAEPGTALIASVITQS